MQTFWESADSRGITTTGFQEWTDTGSCESILFVTNNFIWLSTTTNCISMNARAHARACVIFRVKVYSRSYLCNTSMISPAVRAVIIKSINKTCRISILRQHDDNVAPESSSAWITVRWIGRRVSRRVSRWITCVSKSQTHTLATINCSDLCDVCV